MLDPQLRHFAPANACYSTEELDPALEYAARARLEPSDAAPASTTHR